MEKYTNRILLLVGFLACACRWDSSVFPKVVLMVLCAVPVLFALRSVLVSKCVVASIPIIWYFFFFLIVAGSLLYTPNTKDSMDVVRRCFLSLGLIFSLTQLLKAPKGAADLLNGFVLGSYATLIVTFLNEFQLIGITRIGTLTCGAATTFSSILLIGLSSLFIRRYFFEQKFFPICCLILVAGIVLSGSRMPLLMICLLYLIFSLMLSSNIIKIFRAAVVAVCLIVVAYIAVMHHPVLYDLVGYRIDSMIETFQYGESHETDSSLDGRKRLKEEAVVIWKNNVVLGGGVNSFCELSPFVVGRSTSHCGFTEILCSFGVVGFCLFYWPFMYAIGDVFSRKPRRAKIPALIVILFLASEWQGVSFLSSANVTFYAFLLSLIKYPRLMEKTK